MAFEVRPSLVYVVAIEIIHSRDHQAFGAQLVRCSRTAKNSCGFSEPLNRIHERY